MSRRRSLAHLARAAAFAATLALSGSALATPNFPGAIASKLGGPAPNCSICHVCGVTGRGTVNTPWGAAMRARGLDAYNESLLATALAAMEADRVDSNSDGTIDVEAVRKGDDPNPPTCDEEADPTIPKYGCFGRVAPGSSLPAEIPLLLLVAVVGALAWRRRRIPPGTLGLLLVIAASSALAACGSRSGAGLASREATVRAATPPRMRPVGPTAFTDELRAAGLDPTNLPRFEALTPRQLRRVMGTFTRSLGFACTDCHDRDDHRTSTRTKAITRTMWNELTRPNHPEGGGAVYCDSCHHGEGRFLDRRDKKQVAAYMADEYMGKLERKDKVSVECETCHGDPFRPLFLPR